jgi:uncharacterized protein (DUF58 family)
MEGFMTKLADIVFRVVFSGVTAFLLLAAVVVFLLWRLYLRLRSRALEQVEYERSFSAQGVFCGTELRMTEELRNPTWFPLFFVEVSFFAPDGLCFDGVERHGYQRLRSVFQLMPHSRAVREHTVRALRRDRYYMSSAQIVWRDNAYEFDVPLQLSVYPAQFEAPLDILPDSHRLGDRLAANRFIEDPYFTSGIRTYRRGDPMRNIDFKASARMLSRGRHQLMSRDCDSSRNFDAMVLLDLTPYPEVCSTLKHNRALTENGLRLACYLLRETVRNGGRFGLAANIESLKYTVDRPFILIPCDTGMPHMKEVLETFAAIPVYRTAREYSFSALIHEFRTLIPRDMDVYLLTGASDAGHGGVIRELERAGNTVTVVRIPITEMN